MYILASEFFEKDEKYILKLEIGIVCREFLAYKFFFFFREKKIDDHLYFYIRNL